MYITCSVMMCDANDPFSRCAQGCLASPSRRRKRGLGLETVRHSIIQGPLQFVKEDAPVAAVDKSINGVVAKHADMPAEG